MGPACAKRSLGEGALKSLFPAPVPPLGLSMGPARKSVAPPLRETKTQAEIAKAVLVDVGRILAEEPELYGVEIIDLTIRGATVPE